MNLVLFGFKTSGKTAVGTLVAKKLHKTFVDIDKIIEDLYYNPLLGRPKQLTVSEIFVQHGEEFFRALERDAVRKLRLVKNGIIATGGGTLIDHYSHAEIKKNGLLIYLKTDFEVIKERILKLKKMPAFLDANDIEGSLRRVFQERLPIYERIADEVIDTQGKSLDIIADNVCSLSRG